MAGQSSRFDLNIMSGNIHILLVDDHSLVRDGIEAILQLESDFNPIHHAASCAEALAAIARDAPDLILLDRRMTDGDGFDLLATLRELVPATRIIMMTASATPSEVERGRRLGASGHLSKSVRRATLIGAIRHVIAGGTHFEHTPHATTGQAVPLSPRELDVLENIRRGLTNHEIAVALGIGEYTVKAHVKSVFSKLGAANRSEAVNLGFELGLLNL